MHRLPLAQTQAGMAFYSLVSILLGLFLSAPSMAANTQQTEQTMNPTTLVQQAFSAWSKGTGGPFDLLAEDAVWTITGNSFAAKSYTGKEAFMREVIRPFNARMSVGLKPTIRSLYEDGDTVVVHFDASGTAKDGKPYTNTYAWFLTFREGKISRAVAFFDSLAFNDLWTRVSP